MLSLNINTLQRISELAHQPKLFEELKYLHTALNGILQEMIEYRKRVVASEIPIETLEKLTYVKDLQDYINDWEMECKLFFKRNKNPNTLFLFLPAFLIIQLHNTNYFQEIRLYLAGVLIP
jgi:hypothetical protein